MSTRGARPLGAAALLLVASLAAAATAPKAPAIAVPASIAPGGLAVLRVPPGARPPAEVLFLERRYPPLAVAGEPGPVFLIGADLEQKPGRAELRLRYADGAEERRAVTVVPGRFPEERLTLPPAMVTPPAALEERIAREQALAAEVYRTSAPTQLWDRGFARALAQRAAGNFGKRRILNGLPRSPHAGQDYTAPAGTPVRAVARGRARLCRDFYYSGLTVVLDHGAGLVSQYLHLEKILVEEGAIVEAGQVVGRVGSTGRATGPHLHLGLRLFEQRVDPERLAGLFPRQGARD